MESRRTDLAATTCAINSTPRESKEIHGLSAPDLVIVRALDCGRLPRISETPQTLNRLRKSLRSAADPASERITPLSCSTLKNTLSYCNSLSIITIIYGVLRYTQSHQQNATFHGFIIKKQ